MPKVLKGHGGSSSSTPPAATTTTTSGYAPSATPSGTPVASAAVLPATSTKLTNSDVAPRRSKSELYSFSQFSGKDPFVQQVSASDITSSPSGTSGGSGSSAAGGTCCTSGPA